MRVAYYTGMTYDEFKSISMLERELILISLTDFIGELNEAGAASGAPRTERREM